MAYGQAAENNDGQRLKGVVYPEVEHEMPDFVIWSPDDLLEEARLKAEEEALKAMEEARLKKIEEERIAEEAAQAEMRIEEARQASIKAEEERLKTIE